MSALLEIVDTRVEGHVSEVLVRERVRVAHAR